MNLKKTNPFTVPEGYFDHLQDDIMQRIDNKNKQISHKTSYMRMYIAVVSAAACVAIIVTLALWPQSPFQQMDMAAANHDEETLYQLLYMSDRTSLLAETILEDDPVQSFENKDDSAEDEHIIRFLERDMTSTALQYAMTITSNN